MVTKEQRRAEIESKFVKLRNALQEESQLLGNYIHLFRLIEDKKNDRLRAINQAPAFFQLSQKAILSSIIVWSNKLFLDKRSAVGYPKYLKFVEDNLGIFSLARLKKRVDKLDGTWLRNRKSVTRKDVVSYRQKIVNLSGLMKSLKFRRDKYEAHFDSKYKNNISEIGEKSPITWGDLDDLVQAMDEILNEFSVAFDGNSFPVKVVNIDDLNSLLNIVHKGLIARDEKMKERRKQARKSKI